MTAEEAQDEAHIKAAPSKAFCNKASLEVYIFFFLVPQFQLNDKIIVGKMHLIRRRASSNVKYISLKNTMF